MHQRDLRETNSDAAAADASSSAIWSARFLTQIHKQYWFLEQWCVSQQFPTVEPAWKVLRSIGTLKFWNIIGSSAKPSSFSTPAMSNEKCVTHNDYFIEADRWVKLFRAHYENSQIREIDLTIPTQDSKNCPSMWPTTSLLIICFDLEPSQSISYDFYTAANLQTVLNATRETLSWSFPTPLTR